MKDFKEPIRITDNCQELSTANAASILQKIHYESERLSEIELFFRHFKMQIRNLDIRLAQNLS